MKNNNLLNKQFNFISKHVLLNSVEHSFGVKLCLNSKSVMHTILNSDKIIKHTKRFKFPKSMLFSHWLYNNFTNYDFKNLLV